ncbi:MAG: hypothetical protein ABI175_10445, partial [Polyangiales bacterium]
DDTDNESPDLVVTAHGVPPHVAAGAVLSVELVLENRGSKPLRVDLPPADAFRPELVVFSPKGNRIEPPDGTPACPLHDTGRFVAGKVQFVIAPGGRAHAAMPWKARIVTWDEARHIDSGRCAVSVGAPLPKGTYEIKVISDMLGTSSDVAARNPRLHVVVE